MSTRNNLISLADRDKEDRQRIARMGALASAETKRKRKSLQEELLFLLSEGNTQKEISVALIQKAMNGDTKAFETIRDTVGEKPTDKMEIKDITPKWFKNGTE